jgi:chromosome segregation ATPase
MNESETNMQHIPEAGIIVSKLTSNTNYFESRFDILQNNYQEVRRSQDSFKEQLRDLKIDMDRRFNETHSNMIERFTIVNSRIDDTRSDMLERFAIVDRRIDDTRSDMLERFKQVDKRFEQVDKRFEQVDKRFEQVDKRFEQVDKRFEQVDKRFEQIDLRLSQIILSIDKLGDKIDQKDDRQRRFTLKMFSIAISVTGLSIMGVLFKILNIV